MGSLLVSSFRLLCFPRPIASSNKKHPSTVTVHARPNGTSLNKDPNVRSWTTGALARPAPQLPDNRSTPPFRFFLSPLYKTLAKEKQQKRPPPPPSPKSQVRGAPATGWRQERCAAHSEQVALGPSSITDQSREREREGERGEREQLQRC